MIGRKERNQIPVTKVNLMIGIESNKAFVIFMVNKMLICVLFLSYVIWVCSSTLLWRIETKPPAFIFGSIHTPYQLVWPYVANETREAFLSSTHVYAEVDSQDDSYWDDFLQCVIKRSNRTRRSNRSFYAVDLLDVYLVNEARRLNKTVGSLETVDSHCQNIGPRYDVPTWRRILDTVKREMKNGTIRLQEKKMQSEKVLIKKYNCDGITSQYFRTLLMSKKEKKYVEQRDKQMSRYIHQLLQNSTKNRYFFAVGAAHMLNNHRNLKVQLKTFGYKIKQVCTDRKRIMKKYGCRMKKPVKTCTKKKKL